jgi:uncharacterized protein (DUF302 family)
MSDPAPAPPNEYTTKPSPRSVDDTVRRLTELVEARGMTVFSVIDQRAYARGVGLELRETVLVLFGDPRGGTPVMASEPLAALDLPLKVVVWADDAQTRVSYLSPAALAARHRLDAGLAAPLSGIDALTDELVRADS